MDWAFRSFVFGVGVPVEVGVGFLKHLVKMVVGKLVIFLGVDPEEGMAVLLLVTESCAERAEGLLLL